MAAKFKPCSVIGCNGNSYRVSFGFCPAHLARFKRHGNPLHGGALRIVARKGDIEAWMRSNVGYTGDDCLAWPFAKKPEGYGKLTRDGITYGAHRVMCEIAHGKPPTPEHQAAHSCGNGHEGCVNPKHLRWATGKENGEDMVAHGKSNRGTRYPTSKLNEELVTQIRALKGQMRTADIAEKFGVSRALVGMIQNRKRWDWLE